MKKLIVIIFSLFFLTACGKKEKELVVPDSFRGPTTGPDIEKLQPSFGPNDPSPAFDLSAGEAGN